MPLDSRLVGQCSEGVTQDVDARWSMAYAAGLGDTLAAYFDASANDPVMAHPLFPVCLEWQVPMAPEPAGTVPLTRDEAARGVHATHDVWIHRPICAGDRLTTTATTVGIEQRNPGAYRVQRFDTHDADGRAVCTTYNGALLLDVPVVGEDRWVERPPATPEPSASGGSDQRFEIEVRSGLAHIYTECARIWNPIHTDRAVALRAGLPDIILHGTATLALALSKLVEGVLGGKPQRVGRVCCRFGAMVLMPSVLTLEVTGATESELAFRVLTAQGGGAINAGYVAFG